MKWMTTLLLCWTYVLVEGDDRTCPDLSVEVQALQPFNKSFPVSVASCTLNCEDHPSLINVTLNDEGFRVSSINSSSNSFRIEGDNIQPGDTKFELQYEFLCFKHTPMPTAKGSLLIRGVEMELKLDQYDYEGRNIHSPAVPSGFNVNLSCFSHLNDSSDIPVKFHLRYGDTTQSVACPDTGMECSKIPDRKWSVCRNESKPHNCILVLREFGDSDDGTYSCSTTIGGREVQSNQLELHALSTLEPTKSSQKSSEIGIVLPIVAAVILILFILGFILFKIVNSRRHRGGYQPMESTGHSVSVPPRGDQGLLETPPGSSESATPNGSDSQNNSRSTTSSDQTSSEESSLNPQSSASENNSPPLSLNSGPQSGSSTSSTGVQILSSTSTPEGTSTHGSLQT